MAFTDIFIRRPVMASVLSLLVLLVGLMALFRLPVRQFPEVQSTTITITTAYPGANADLTAGFLTSPIEQAVSSTEGLDTLVSSSTQSTSKVTLNLRLGADPDRAMADVLSKINQVRNQLPREALDPIAVKQSGNGTALMYISFNSSTMQGAQITDYLTRVVQPRLQTIDGVAQAQILGGQTFAMRIWLDPDHMAAMGVTPVDVRTALAANNFATAAGEVKGDFIQTSIDAKTLLDKPGAFEKLVVASRGATLVRLGDVAKIDLGPESATSSSVFNGQKAIFLGIFSTPSANPLTVINAVRNAMPQISGELPAGLTAAIAYDATAFIRASIYEVVKTLGEAALIVIIVIFLFLGSLRATLVPIVTIPLSLVGAMIGLLALGFSINLLTLLALVLAIGLVVDDAIVVVENVHRHIEQGMSRQEAALQGAREIALPVVAMTITLAAVYAPIGFVTGLTGALFREFAFTLAFSVIVSGVIALTLSPMMCSRVLEASRTRGRFAAGIDRVFDALRRRYRHRLERSLAWRAVTLVVLVGTIALTALMYLTSQRELAPEEDQGILMTTVKAPQYANLDYIEHATLDLYRGVEKLPERSFFFAINGFPDLHQAFAGLLLKPWGDRKRTAKQILQTLQPTFGNVAGAQVFAFSPPPLPGTGFGTPVQFVITTTHGFTELAKVASTLRDAAQKSGNFIFTDVDLQIGTPQLDLAVDSDKANQLGITMQDVGTALATMLGGNYVNRFNLEGRSYEVIPQVPRAYRLDAAWLTRYRVKTKSGALMPLASVVKVGRSVGPNALTKFQQLNAATISAVPFPGRTLGDGLDFLAQQARNLPAGYSFDYQGQSRQYVQEGNTLVYTFVFALIVIYLVLAAQFESWRDPLIILIALPTSMLGALLPINFGLASINIYTQIGLVTMIGLISKHGILMVDFANHLQAEQGLDRRAAIAEAAAVRLRPILMTTAAMVVGMVPLLLASGAGAVSRFDIGLVIAAGMSVGTLFTLFVTPAVYSYVARTHT